MRIFQGVATALLTPFIDNDFSIDYDQLALHIDWQIKNGINALVIGSTTGEAVALSEEEHKALIAFAVQAAAGRVPVIAGTGSNDTAHTIRMTQHAARVGAAGVLVVTPYYNKPTQKGLIAHYSALHNATDIPIILYNVPSRTGINMTAQTVLALSKLPRVVGLKEASNDFSQITELARLLPEDFALYSGNDDTVIPFMSLRGQGVISVASNIIPGTFGEMVAHCLRGNADAALALQLNLKPFIDTLFIESNPTPAKCASNLLGRQVGPLRLPLVEVEEATKLRILEEINRLNLQSGWQ